MHFLYPTFLWAMTALAIPIIVHLFNFRRAKLVKFSNVRFLENVKKKSASKKRLKHLLILASRLLFLFFLVIAFAQPFLPGEESGLNASEVKIYLDNSASMSNAASAEEVALTTAVNHADEIIRLYPAHTKFRLITNSFDPSSNHFRNQEQTSGKILETDYASAMRFGDEIFSRIIDRSSNDEIFVISDFQLSTMRSFGGITDSNSLFHIIPISYDEQDNLFVDSVYLQTPFVIAGQRNQLIVRLRNQSQVPTEDAIIKLYVNGRQTASATSAVDPMGHAEIKFELDRKLESINLATIQIEDYPVVFDNEFYFTLNAARSVRVVEITEEADTSPVSQVFLESSLFNFNTYPKGNISYDILRQADLLIVNSLTSIDNGLRNQITQLLANGKSVTIIPSASSDMESYSQALGFKLTSRENPDTVRVNLSSSNHPFFENVFDKIEKNSILPRVKCLVEWTALDDALLVSETGEKFLSQINTSGNLYLFAGPVNGETADLYKNALFVPIMQRMAERSGKNDHRLYYHLDNNLISLRLDSAISDGLYKLVKDDVELIPGQRLNGNMLHLDIPKHLMTTGFYEVYHDETLITAIAINNSKLESDLAQPTIEELEAQLSGISNKTIYSGASLDSLSNALKEKYVKLELWKYALILSLAFLLAEALLIRFL